MSVKHSNFVGSPIIFALSAVKSVCVLLKVYKTNIVLNLTTEIFKTNINLTFE